MRKNDNIYHSQGFNVSHIKWKKGKKKKSGMFPHKNSGINSKQKKKRFAIESCAWPSLFSTFHRDFVASHFFFSPILDHSNFVNLSGLKAFRLQKHRNKGVNTARPHRLR